MAVLVPTNWRRGSTAGLSYAARPACSDFHHHRSTTEEPGLEVSVSMSVVVWHRSCLHRGLCEEGGDKWSPDGRGVRPGELLVLAIALVSAVVLVYPTAWVFFASFKTQETLFSGEFADYTLENYRRLFASGFGVHIGNSLVHPGHRLGEARAGCSRRARTSCWSSPTTWDTPTSAATAGDRDPDAGPPVRGGRVIVDSSLRRRPALEFVITFLI
jgi:hypothetical protein